MKLSDGIEKFIIGLLNEQSGTAEIGRNELAPRFRLRSRCVII